MSTVEDIVAWADENAGEDDEWERERELIPSEVRVCRENPVGVVVTTKPHCLWKMLPDLAPGFSVHASRWPIPNWHAELVASDPASREKVIFVGDLDALDLLSFATLLHAAKLDPARAHFAGPIDAWLDALSAEHKKMIAIEMSDFERELWGRVRGLALDWDARLGPRAMALLDAGHKIELDGAMNPAIYGEAFTLWAGVRVLQHWARIPSPSKATRPSAPPPSR